MRCHVPHAGRAWPPSLSGMPPGSQCVAPAPKSVVPGLTRDPEPAVEPCGDPGRPGPAFTGATKGRARQRGPGRHGVSCDVMFAMPPAKVRHPGPAYHASLALRSASVRTSRSPSAAGPFSARDGGRTSPVRPRRSFFRPRMPRSAQTRERAAPETALSLYSYHSIIFSKSSLAASRLPNFSDASGKADLSGRLPQTPSRSRAGNTYTSGR